jgi:trehalose 6-phosphate phosphatase
MVGKTRELLRSWSEAPDSAAILTDIDGTLAPIVPTPDMSEVPAELKELLRRLSERYLSVCS